MNNERAINNEDLSEPDPSFKKWWVVLSGFCLIVLVVGYGLYLNRSVDKRVVAINEENLKGSKIDDRSLQDMHKGVKDFSVKGKTVGVERSSIKEHFDKGLRYSLLNEHDNAIEEFKEVVKIDPNIAEVYNNLGFAYLDKGNTDDAILTQQKAMEINPDLANAYYGLALALEKKGDKEGAVKNWERYLKLAPPETVWWNKAKERLDKIK